ncbi:hypothetical protein C8J57DRAFT_1297340 [Mycena rebaudengoi]|nr:hypothetical protein C8J57DRAFT_1297340 [Mycena rebaudengoi]
MCSMSETSLSFISSILPNSTANTIIGASILATVTALVIHHISPTRLTRVLVSLMHETDATYIGAITDSLSKLQIKASQLREESLRNSLSIWKMLAEFLCGRSLALYCCIRVVQGLKTRIEISKEKQLHNLNPTGGAGTAAWAMSARRRHIHPPGSHCNCRCI